MKSKLFYFVLMSFVISIIKVAANLRRRSLATKRGKEKRKAPDPIREKRALEGLAESAIKTLAEYKEREKFMTLAHQATTDKDYKEGFAKAIKEIKKYREDIFQEALGVDKKLLEMYKKENPQDPEKIKKKILDLNKKKNGLEAMENYERDYLEREMQKALDILKKIAPKQKEAKENLQTLKTKYGIYPKNRDQKVKTLATADRKAFEEAEKDFELKDTQHMTANNNYQSAKRAVEAYNKSNNRK